MPYADTSFLLAVIKESDWLKKPATAEFEKLKGKLWTSSSAVIEIMLVGARLGMNLDNLIVSLYEIVDVVDMHRDIPLTASYFMQKYGMNVFDAFHAASAGGDEIVTSDSIFAKVGPKTIYIGNAK